MSYPSGVHPGAHSHEKLPIVSTQTWVSYEDDHLIKSNVFKLNIIQIFEFNSFIRRIVGFLSVFHIQSPYGTSRIVICPRPESHL